MPTASCWTKAAITSHAEQLVKEFDVRTPSIWTHAGSFSGGNQQKVIVAREFSRPIKLLVAAQPTRGIDVGSIEFIHRSIIAQRDQGVAVLLVSAELDEILSLADRIAVMFHGRIVATLPAAQAKREQIGLLMAGVANDEVEDRSIEQCYEECMAVEIGAPVQPPRRNWLRTPATGSRRAVTGNPNRADHRRNHYLVFGA